LTARCSVAVRRSREDGPLCFHGVWWRRPSP